MRIGDIQEDYNNKLIAELQAFDKSLYQRILLLLAELTNDGQLTANADVLAQIEQKITNYTKELGYSQIIDDYLKGLDEVDQANREYYKGNSNIENEILNSRLNEEYRNQITDLLRGAGAYEEIVKKVSDLLRLDALRGLSFEDAATALEQLVAPEVGDGISQKYINQVSKDALMQYDGIIQEEIKNKFKPKKFRYLASIIETSRPVCDHIKDMFGNNPISVDQLEVVLNEFCPDGKPSKQRISYTTVNGKEIDSYKGAGMIDGTTTTNFAILRGGYNCRHEVKWIF